MSKKTYIPYLACTDQANDGACPESTRIYVRRTAL